MSASSLRQVTPIAPWATAGSISSVERIDVACEARPRRSSPASASSVASASPSAIFLSRVSTLPRRSTMRRSGRRRLICAPRRNDEVPTTAPAGSSASDGALAADEGVTHIGARQDRGDANSGWKVGLQVLHRVHGEVDVTPASSASSISLVNRPLPPKSRNGLILEAIARGGDSAQADMRLRRDRWPRAGVPTRAAPATAPADCRGYRSGGAGPAR